jgi:glutathione S-transferase
MMVSVLLGTRRSGILDEFASLAAYVARGEARLRTSERLPRSW